ncbi:MAG: hypothetical protein AVDCRST_MAG52-1989, partial [uncultured Blastococcus sp.]
GRAPRCSDCSFVNRAAGTADEDSVRAAVRELRRGAEVTVAETADREALTAAVAGRDGPRLVIAGGDGSVHAAVEALTAPRHCIPASLSASVRTAPATTWPVPSGCRWTPSRQRPRCSPGHRAPSDLLRDDDGGLALNAVHVGIGARAYAEATRFENWMRTAAFPLGAAVAGVTTTAWNLRVEIDGRVAAHGGGDWAADGDTAILMVAVCNGPTIAGGTPLAPDARLDDGLADVVLSTATGPLAHAAFATSLLTGRHVDRADVLIAQAREVTFSEPVLQPDADGELQPAVATRTWRVEQHAWSVIAPS